MNETLFFLMNESGNIFAPGGLKAAFAIIIIFAIISFVASLLPLIILIISTIKIFKKAGKPGWAAIVPIYNVYVMWEIAEKPWWYLLLLAMPFANIYAIVVIMNGVAKKFGKSTGFTIGMILLPYIFFPILGFEKSYMVEESITSYEESSTNSVPTYEQPVMQNAEPVSQPMFEQPVIEETMDMIDSSVQPNVENASVDQEFAQSEQLTSLWSNNNNNTQI